MNNTVFTAMFAGHIIMICIYMDERCGQLEYGNIVTSDCAFLT